MSKSPDPEARVASSHRAPQTLKAEAAVPTGVAIQSRAHEYITYAYSKVVIAVSDLVEDARNFTSCFANE